jgi:17beta-estradiol 17-dehydrogenase / very-long-chain 3-oxoacyl-CoA reductase
MAIEFARKGINVVLISRNQENLDATVNEIKEKSPNVEVRTLAINYANFDTESQKKVTNLLADIEVGILVNNVGISYDFTTYFHEIDDEQVNKLIALNVESTTYMTRIVLPGMITRRRGAIINISSAAGITISPLLAQYSAAKSYVAMFSQALHEELKDFNIHVQCQVPLFVTTKLAKLKKPSIFVPTPINYAKSALKCIGYEPLISPYWSHALQLYILASLPEAIAIYITKSMHKDIRKRGLAKLAQKEKEKRN